MNTINFKRLSAFDQSWKASDILVFEKILFMVRKYGIIIELNKKAAYLSLHIGRQALESSLDFLSDLGIIELHEAKHKEVRKYTVHLKVILQKFHDIYDTQKLSISDEQELIEDIKALGIMHRIILGNKSKPII